MAKNVKILILFIILGVIIALGINYFSTQETSPEFKEKLTTFENLHPDLPLPEDTVWQRSNYAGVVEQHNFIFEGSVEELFNFLKENLPEKGWKWILTYRGNTAIYFVKEETQAAFLIGSSPVVGQTNFTLIFEPEELEPAKEWGE